MAFFDTREQAREFADKKSYREVIDTGSVEDSKKAFVPTLRWGVKI